MKDSTGIDLVRGDLIMITIDTPVERTAEIVMYLDIETLTYNVTVDGTEQTRTTDTLHYYPLTDLGLEVARYDNDNIVDTIYRSKKYTTSNIESKNMLKMDTNTLRGYNKVLYNSLLLEL